MQCFEHPPELVAGVAAEGVMLHSWQLSFLLQLERWRPSARSNCRTAANCCCVSVWAEMLGCTLRLLVCVVRDSKTYIELR